MILINDYPITVNHFQDNTQKLNLDGWISLYHNSLPYIEIHWKYENDEELMTLIHICGYFTDNFPDKTKVLYLLYVPNSRMDRVEQFGDVFTLKYFCSVINSLDFDSVYVLDTHSKVTDALIDKIVKLDINKYINSVLDKIHLTYFNEDFNKLTVVFPDRGAYDRYSNLETLISFKKIIGNKSRDWNSGKLYDQKLYGLDQLQQGEPVLILDDILSTGGTICKTIENIKEVTNCPIYLYISHLENALIINNTENWQFIYNNVNTIYTAKSIYNQNNSKVVVI